MRLAVALLAALFALPAGAREIDPAERREVPYNAHIPACDDRAVLQEIAVNFATREDRFWMSGLRIVHYERVRQLAWRDWGLDYIPRRFCSGTVLTNDGVKRRIEFSVREDLGIIGLRWGTDWCIVGLDRHYAYAPFCKQAQP